MDGGDGDQPPECAGCRFIPRSCPPNCPLAPHFVPGEIHAADFSGLNPHLQGKTVIESTRSYPTPELRRIFVEQAVNVAIGTSAGKEGRRLLIEAILSEAEKESYPERPKRKSPPCSSSSSSLQDDPFLPSSSAVLDEAAAKFLTKLADVADGMAAFDALVAAFGEGMSLLEVSLDQDRDHPDDDPDSEQGMSPSEGSFGDDITDDEVSSDFEDFEGGLKLGGSSGVDQELGVNGNGYSGGLSNDDDDDDGEFQPEKKAKRLKIHKK